MVAPTDYGFLVPIPPSASPESPVRVAVDVEMPPDFIGQMIGFTAWLCTEMVSGECATGHHLSRAIPIEAPIP